MARRILLGIFVLFAVLIAIFCSLFIAIVFFGTYTATSSVAMANGRVVSVSVRSIYHGIETSGNTATVRTMRAKVVIEPTKFTIDDQFSGAIPPAAKTVDVNIDGSKVNISADGVPLTPSGP